MTDSPKQAINHNGVVRTPWVGKCADEACGYSFVVAYLPMELHLAARLAQSARCPMCAGKKVFCA